MARHSTRANGSFGGSADGGSVPERGPHRVVIAQAPAICVMNRRMACREHRALLERRYPVGRNEDPVTVIGGQRILAPSQRLRERTFRVRRAPAADEAEAVLKLLQSPDLGGEYLDRLARLPASGAEIE